MTADEGFNKKYIEIMETASMLYFTTLNKDQFPETRCVFNLRNRTEFPMFTKIFEQEQNPFTIYIGTNTSSGKVAELRENPKCAIYYCLPDKFRGINFTGKAEIIDDQELKETFWEDDWSQFYPLGPGDPDYTLLRIRPEKARGWYSPNKFEFSIR